MDISFTKLNFSYMYLSVILLWEPTADLLPSRISTSNSELKSRNMVWSATILNKYSASNESHRLSAFNEQQNPTLFRKSDIGLLKHLDIRKIITLHWMSILPSSFKLFNWTKKSSEHICMLSEPIALSILSSLLWNCMKLIYCFWKILTIQFLQ